MHPGMTFVRKSVPTLEGVPFGVEGDAAAVRLAKKIVQDLGGTAFQIKKQNKVLYHAFDAFASPMVIALMTALEQVGKAAGIKPADLRTMAAPLLRQTLANYLEHGAAAAFSGPLVRGDVATVRRHLAALAKDAGGAGGVCQLVASGGQVSTGEEQASTEEGIGAARKRKRGPKIEPARIATGRRRGGPCGLFWFAGTAPRARRARPLPRRVRPLRCRHSPGQRLCRGCWRSTGRN